MFRKIAIMYIVENDVYRYYNNYFLDDLNTYDLTKKQTEILDNAILSIDNNWSLRKLSREIGLSKSQLSRDFQTLKTISRELYLVLRKQYKNRYERYFKDKFFI